MVDAGGLVLDPDVQNLFQGVEPGLLTIDHVRATGRLAPGRGRRAGSVRPNTGTTRAGHWLGTQGFFSAPDKVLHRTAVSGPAWSAPSQLDAKRYFGRLNICLGQGD